MSLGSMFVLQKKPAMPVSKYANPLSIKSWAEDDRPREKLMFKGKASLSDAELLAILINSGTRKHTAVDLAKMILQKANNDLNALGKFTISDFTAFEGIGQARAITIMAALELGRRRKALAPNIKAEVITSRDAYNLMRPHLMDLPHEEFWVIFLNRAGRVLLVQQVSVGGTVGTVADPKVIFKKALEIQGCARLILVHNHPSGNPQPSQADINLTRSMKAAGKVLQLDVVDHVIYAEHGFYSFADESMM